MLAEDAGDLRKYAGPVLGLHPEVVAGHALARLDEAARRRRSPGTGTGTRRPAARSARCRPSTAEAVGPAPAPLPVRITGSVMSQSNMMELYSCRTEARWCPAGIMVGWTRMSILPSTLLGDAQELYHVAHVAGVGDVDRADLGDPLDRDVLESNGLVEGDHREEGDLVPGVKSLDVEGRVRLGEALFLRVPAGRRQRACPSPASG